MPPATRLTPAQEDELVELYKAGEGVFGVAAAFAISPARARRLLDERGVPRHPPGRRRQRPAQPAKEKRPTIQPRRPAFHGREDELVERYQEEGWSINRLAATYGSSATTVRKLLERRGLKIRKNAGGRPSAKRQRMLEEAAQLHVDAAPAEVTCTYRPTEYRDSARSSDGEKRMSRTRVTRPPMCGRPVKVTLEGDRHPLCDLHQSARKDYADSAEEIAIRGRAELTQSCGRCGLSWTTTALRASASWQAHQRRCEARSEAA